MEIFEGDIVRDTYKSVPLDIEKRELVAADFVGVIKFGRHSVRSDDPFCSGYALGFYADGLFTPALDDHYNEFEALEVIGDIHRNPELVSQAA